MVWCEPSADEVVMEVMMKVVVKGEDNVGREVAGRWSSNVGMHARVRILGKLK
jgi:hypothetical protein